MSVAIIIVTHGHAAEQLSKTAEMILGKQENMAFVDFIPGENAEVLEQKYQACLTNLTTEKGLLFLVDMWGGSPFNAASHFVHQHENSNIIAGVNIPMLLEVFMGREDNLSLNELVERAISSGKEGIKVLKEPIATVAPTATNITKSAPPPPRSPSEGGHMTINLLRIDDRLIHGQVVTRWSKEGKITRIIVVNDQVAADQVRKTLLSQVAPPGVTAHVVDVAKAIRVYNNPKYADDNVMLLFTNPQDVLHLAENGVKFDSVNIGGMAFKQGKHAIADAVSIDDKDEAAFRKLHQLGIELEIRKVPSDTKTNLMSLLDK